MPEDLAEAITDNKEAPAIVHAVPVKKHNNVLDLETSFLKYLRGIQSNSKELKTYNIFDNDPDFRDDYGWTSTVTKKQLKQLKHHNIGFFMVNLTMVSDHIIAPLIFKIIHLIYFVCVTCLLNLFCERDQCWGHIGIHWQQK